MTMKIKGVSHIVALLLSLLLTGVAAAQTAISALPAGTTIVGTEVLPGVQSGATVKFTFDQAKTFTSASPTLVTPTLGIATATSINKVALTAPATSATLTIANGKTLTASNTLTFTGTDTSSVAFGAGGTVLYSGGALGTPASGTLTNATGLPAAGVVGTAAILGANTFTATQTITPAVNTNALASTGYSLTGSNASSFIDLAGTWNTSGTPTAIKMNITDTASNAASLFMDLQLDSASQLSINRVGTITNPGNGFLTGFQFYITNNNSIAGFYARSDTGGFYLGAADDIALTREAAAFLGLNGSLRIMKATAIPAGGTAAAGYKFSSTANFGVFFGSGAPTLSAAKGSLYLRSDGSGIADRMYVNTDGSTAWTAVATAS